MGKGEHSKRGGEKISLLMQYSMEFTGETRNQDPREHANSKYRIIQAYC